MVEAQRTQLNYSRSFSMILETAYKNTIAIHYKLQTKYLNNCVCSQTTAHIKIQSNREPHLF